LVFRKKKIKKVPLKKELPIVVSDSTKIDSIKKPKEFLASLIKHKALDF